MNSRQDKKAFESLAASNLIPKQELEACFQEAETGQISFSQLLVKKKLIAEAKLLEHYSKVFNIPLVDLKRSQIDPSVTEGIPMKFASYYRFFPYAKENGRLKIAVSRPVDVHFIDEVRFALGMEVETVLAAEKDIDEMLQKMYGLGAETVAQMNETAPKQQEVPAILTSEVEDIEKLAENASVITLVNRIILEAYRKGASDIHLEPLRGKIRLRYRVDGVLYEEPVPAEMRKFFSPIVSRIKIMANLNIVERRLPQDGKTRVRTQDQTLDLRVSSIPTPHGESIVIRLLPTNSVRSLADLKFEEDQLKYFKELLAHPYGIIFVTGPTGSGKSTTLYAGLSSINKVEKKVITIEDPVEYELEGATQIQVAPEVGLTFAHGLRSVLRHDPDVMMIGEVRDLETADIAIRVALTGHLILSTLHTNDAASGVTRLLDIGVEPYLVASSVISFIAQRLVRQICPHCSNEDTSAMEEIKALIRKDLGFSPSKEIKIFRGTGCEHCHGSGYSGRMAIYEMLPVTQEIRKLIFHRASSEDIKKKAREQGMQTMRQYGWRKVLQGITTAAEVMEATPSDMELEMLPAGPAPAKDAAEETPAAAPKENERRQKDIWVDRRAFVRLKYSMPVLYRKVDIEAEDMEFDSPKEAFEEAHTVDISANGISMLLAAEVAAGTALDVRIVLPGDKEEIQCIGRIVRNIPQRDSLAADAPVSYRTAVTFLAISSTDRTKLDRFCKAQSEAA